MNVAELVGRKMIKKKPKVQYISFAKEYVKCGCDVAKAAKSLDIKYATALSWTKRQDVIDLIELHQKTVSIQLEEPKAGRPTLTAKMASDKSFSWKVEKLKHGANLAIPSGAQCLEETDIKAGVACISELNKMEGHYAAEKLVSLNLSKSLDDPDVANAKQIFDDMLEKNRKDY